MFRLTVPRFLQNLRIIILSNLFIISTIGQGIAQTIPEIKPSYRQNSQYSPNQRPLLGDIKEQTPLLAPPKKDLFSPPLIQKKPAPQKLVLRSVTAPTVANFPLNETLLARLEKIHAEILKLPETDEDDNYDNIVGGVDVLVKALEKRPDVMGILGQNLISAHDYITAMQAVSAALAASSNIDDPRAVDGKITAANLAFGKKYADRIRTLLEE